MRRMERMLVRQILRLWTLFTSTPGTVVTMWSNVFRERFRRNRVDLVQLGGQMTNPKDWNTTVKLPVHKKTSRTTTQTRNSVRSSKVASNAGRVLETNDSCGDRAEQEITISSCVCCRLGSGSASSWWESVSDDSVELERVDHLANSVSAYGSSFPVCS